MADLLYSDAVVVVDETGLTLRHYYFPWAGSKRIEFTAIRGVQARPLSWLTGKGRVWGSGNPGYWLPLDAHRASKSTLLILDVGGRVKPCVSPDEPERVLDLLARRVRLE